MTRTRAQELNYQVNSFLAIHKPSSQNWMLLNHCDDFIVIRNDGEEANGSTNQFGHQDCTRSDTKFRLQVRTTGQHQIDLAIFLDSGCCLSHMSDWKDIEVYIQMDPTPLQNSTGDVLYRPEDVQTSSLGLTAL